MEQVRLIVAIALSVLVFLVYDHFFLPKPVPAPVVQEAAQTALVPESTVPGTGGAFAPGLSSAPEPALSPASALATVPAVPVRNFTVQTPLYTVELTSQGAAVSRLVLKKYKETAAEDSPDKELVMLPPGEVTLATAFLGGSVGTLAEDNWETSVQGDVLDARTAPVRMTFTHASPFGVVVEKTYTFAPDSYLVGLSVKVVNGSSQPVADRLFLSLKNNMSKGSRVVFQGPVVLVDGKVEQVSKIEKQ
ncbi:MAG: membrane protein insertase YidC, partial [Pseudomonadota bacterium]